MVQSNSILIFVPLLDFTDESSIINNFNFTSLQKNLDKAKNFGKFEKTILLNKSLNLNQKKFKKLFGIEFNNKIRLILELYHIKSKTSDLSKKSDLYFFKLELYSSYFIIDYFPFIQRYYEHKDKILDLISILVKEETKSKELINFLKFLYDSDINIPLIHNNILCYKFDNNNDLFNRYRTGLTVFKDRQFEVATDTQGRIMLWLNYMKTRSSSINLKILILRSFLLRFFSWLNFSELKLDYADINQNFFDYYKYLKNQSRNFQFYSKLIKFRNYTIDYNLKLVVFDTLNQSYFLNKNVYQLRITQLEKFISKYVLQPWLLVKYAFVTDSILRNNPQAINFLEKNGWILIYFLKEDKRTDYDSTALTFINELDTLAMKNWSQIFVICSDRDLINFFLKKYSTLLGSSLIFITSSTDTTLNSNTNLSLHNIEALDNINIYYKRT